MAGVFLLTCAVYVHVLTDAFVRWDDGMLIYENPAIRGVTPSTLLWVFTHFDPELYIPFTFITYQINYLLGGVHPFVYHLTNLLLHALNAALVVRVTHLLSGKVRVAVLCGLLFAVHPLHTEAVAWASGRKDVLSTAFFLGAWIAYLRFEEGGAARAYRSSIALHLAGLLSKVMTATLPAVLLLQAALEDPKRLAQKCRSLAPHLLLSAALVAVAVAGKEQLVAATTTWQKVLMACMSTVFYVRHLFWPTNFSLLYPYLGTITITSPDFFIPLILVVLVLALSLVAWRRWPLVSFCILGFIGTLAPTFINFSKGGDLDVYFASDRYAYIPSIFVFLLVAVGIDRVCESLERRGLTHRLFVAVAVVLTVGLSVLAVKQSFVWHNTRTLFAHVIAVYPDASHVAHNNLGNMERLEGNLDAAIVELQKALAIRPNAKTWSNLGAVYRKQGKIAEARDAYAKALTLDPKSAYAHFGLGLVEVQANDADGAQREYAQAMALDPTIEEVPLNYGALLVQQGKVEEGVALYRKALSINPFLTQGHYNLGVALTMLGQTDEAADALREAISLQPTLTPARINLGVLLAKQGDRDGALKQFQAILRYDPQNATAQSAVVQLSVQ